jgi:hypothetical protein
VNGRTEEVVEQQVAVGSRGWRTTEQQVAVETERGGGRGGLAAVVRLRGAGGDQHVGALRKGGTDQELELARLVAAETQAGLVVALDQQPWTAELVLESRQTVQRGRQERQRRARPRGEVDHAGPGSA